MRSVQAGVRRFSGWLPASGCPGLLRTIEGLEVETDSWLISGMESWQLARSSSSSPVERYVTRLLYNTVL